MQTWLIFALTYAFLHALATVFDKHVLKNHKIDPISLSTIRYGINAVIAYFIIAFLIGGIGAKITYGVIAISVIYFFAGITYFYALKFGDVSKLIPYRDAIVVLLSFFLAVVLLSEKFVARDFLGVLVIVIGGYIVWTDGKIIVPKKSPGLALMAASAVFLALNGVMVKSAVSDISPLALSFFMYALVALYFVLISLFLRRKEMSETINLLREEKKILLPIFGASFAATIGVVFQFYALSMQNAAKVLPISGTLPLFAALIGWLALKEKHGAARVFGAILLIVGIYTLQI